MKVRIEIDTKTFVRFWLVVFGFVFAIFAIYSARTALIIIGMAFFLAMALNVPVSRLARILPGRSRVGGTALAFVVVVILLGMFFVLVVPPIVQQTSHFIDTAPQMVQHLSSQWKGLGAFIEKYHIQPQVDSAIEGVRRSTDAWISGAANNLLAGVGSAVSLFTSLLLGLVLTFLMLVEGPMWAKRLWSVYSDKERMEHHRDLATRMYHVVTNYVSGQLAIAGIGATCAGITVFLLSIFIDSVPGNLALPTVAICFTLSLIPMFGATIAGVLVSLLLGFNDITAGLIFATYFLIYQQIENNLISPHIQSKRIDLSPLAVLVAVTIGLYVFGIAGGIISIPIAGCIKVLVEDWQVHSKKQRIENDKPIAKIVRKLKNADETS